MIQTVLCTAYGQLHHEGMLGKSRNADYVLHSTSGDTEQPLSLHFTMQICRHGHPGLEKDTL